MPNFLQSIRALKPFAACAVSALLLGCSGQAPAPLDTKAAPPKTSKPPSLPEDSSLVSTQKVRLSVFNVPRNARDPFFPASARTQEKPAEGQPAAPVNIPSLLQEGFAGVMGNQERRLALVHNAILQAGKSAVITVEVNGKPLEIPVKCLEITRSFVTLQVQGLAQPVKLTRQLSTQ